MTLIDPAEPELVAGSSLVCMRPSSRAQINAGFSAMQCTLLLVHSEHSCARMRRLADQTMGWPIVKLNKHRHTSKHGPAAVRLCKGLVLNKWMADRVKLGDAHAA